MPSFMDLREFIAELERRGDLVRIAVEVDPNLEMTEIADRTLRGGGPASGATRKSISHRHPLASI